MPHPPLPESTLGTPDDTEGVHSVAHSIRQHGALLHTVVSSTSRMTVHGAAVSEASAEWMPASTLGTTADAIPSPIQSVMHGALLYVYVLPRPPRG